MIDFYTKTHQLACNTDMPVNAICRAAKIKPRWFYDFCNEKFKDPGVRKTIRLYQVLTDYEATTKSVENV
jgi:hypothetical protein